MTTLLVALIYLGAAINVYLWAEGGESAAIHLGIAVFAFGAAQYLTVSGLRR